MSETNSVSHAARAGRSPTLLSLFMGFVGALLVVVGCGRTEEPTKSVESVQTTAEALTAADWPAETLVATNSLQLDQRARLEGSAAVRQASPGPVLAHSAELALEVDARITGAVRADTLFLDSRAVVNGTGGYNTRSGTGTIDGAITTPLPLPLAITIPALPTVTTGSTAITVTSNQVLTRAAGAYSTVTLNQGNGGGTTKLILSGGTFHFSSLTLAADARVECSADCEIRVNGRVQVGARSFIGPATGLGVSNVRIAVRGSNGAAGPSGLPAAVNLDNDARLQGYLLATNGTVRLGQRALARGKLIVRDAVLGLDSITTNIQLPVITQHPANASVAVGQSASFTVVATGTGLSYQWQRNGSNVANATAATLPRVGVIEDNGAQFRAVVSNEAGAVTSNAATLTVTSCAASDTVCNGLDDDCNGTVDEDFVPYCGAGAGSPRVTCVNGQEVNTSCVDANACNGAESCSSGTCQAGTPPTTNDNNPCTADSCDPVQGVTHTPAAPGTACADSTLCNGAETCNASGACQAGTPPVVNDGNPCTADSCDAVQGVVHTPVAPGTSCADMNACNGAESCNAGGVCASGSAPAVDDGNPCTADACDAILGVTHVPVAAGTSCADGNQCNGGEICNNSGACQAGVPPVVDDGNVCTADSCNPATGVQHIPVAPGSSCADANACNGSEVCSAAGSCLAGTAPPVDDGNPCTADACEASAGVTHTPVAAGTSCADSNQCNGAEACNASGACQPGTAPVVDDDNVCTSDSCNPSTGVAHAPVAAGTSCADANQCNGAEACNANGACQPGTPPVVDDDNVCTNDSCNPASGVAHSPVAPGTPCADTNACNGAEACNASGACQAGTPPVLDDNNPCTADSCAPATGIAHEAVAAGTSCADSNACNGAEACNASGACQAGTPPVADDDNPCTTDSCDPATGVSHAAVLAGVSCADSNLCNGAEVCDGSGTCEAGTPLATNDDNLCTTDSCDPAAGVTHVAVAAGTTCADANACNGAETCNASGACQAGTPPPVDDGNLCTADSCDPATGVAHVAVAAGASCADADQCNGAETCNGSGLCQLGTPPVVDDSNPCTSDSCDALLGTVHTPVNAGTSCSDSNQCNGAETCNANGACTSGTSPVVDDNNPCTSDSCDPAGGVTHTAVAAGTSCADANACNGAEACNGNGSCTAGTPPVLDDQNPCTADACDASTGVSHAPVAPGTACGDTNACNGAELCNASGSCQAGTAPVLDDGNPCTADSCDATNGVTHQPVAVGTSCADANLCNGAETCNAAGSCAAGTAPVLDDGNLCTVDACSPTTGVSHQPAATGSSCADTDLCNGDETCNSNGVCTLGTPLEVDDGSPCTADECDPELGAVHVPADAGTSCADSDVCNGAEACNASGECAPGTPLSLPPSSGCTTYTCDPVLGVVSAQAPVGAGCAVDLCTDGQCSADGECLAVGALDMDDGDACTIDRCDPVNGPVHIACSAIDPNVNTTVFAATQWIYTGPNAVQTGVVAGTIDVRRAALIRGRVETRDGEPIPGVVINVAGHAEYGTTTTHANGTYDLVVNGGDIELSFRKPDYLASARSVVVGWNATTEVDKVVLIPPDPVVTPIDLTEGGDYQIGRGSVISDDSGQREGTLLFPPGVTATMRHANGTTEQLSQMNIRITEFTVGESGPAAMPASLPPNAGYTYAFEANADEAVAANAPEITFSTPLIYYVENFLGFPAGAVVPLGSYDREKGRWTPEQNGVVLKIVSITSGVANIDITGDGVAESTAALNTAGITVAERTKMAALYSTNTSLWRVLLPHFTEPYDANWPVGFPNDAKDPLKKKPSVWQQLNDTCEVDQASTIECQNQVFREDISLVGAEFGLHYSSARVVGRKDSRVVEVQVTDNAPPASLEGIGVSLMVAGTHKIIGVPKAPNAIARIEWDGLDAYGRRAIGRQHAVLGVTYSYPGVYNGAKRFGSPSNGPVYGGNNSRDVLYMTQFFDIVLGSGGDYSGLGGWSPTPHHAYSPTGNQLLRGDGTSVDARSVGPTLENIAGEFGVQATFGDGGNARKAYVLNPSSVAVGADGSTYIATQFRIRKVSPNGIITTVAGTGQSGHTGDNGTATAARISPTGQIAVGADGSILFGERDFDSVRRVRPDGIITTVVGDGTNVNAADSTAGDNGPATAARPRDPHAVAVSPDGSFYVASNSFVRRVSTDGIITTVAGSGASETSGFITDDNALALSAPLGPQALALDGTGRLYILQQNTISGSPGDRVYRLGSNGRLTRLAGCRSNAGCLDLSDVAATSRRLQTQSEGLALGSDGRLFIAADNDPSNNTAFRVMEVDEQNIIRTIYNGPIGYRTGEVAARHSLQPTALAMGPGGLVVAELLQNRVTGLRRALPDLGVTDQFISSQGGTEIYVFNSQGRHLRTLDALTLAPVWTFGYTGSGLLQSLQDEAGRQTMIERDSTGAATAIVTPDGQRTDLSSDENGYLATATDPLGNDHSFEYSDEGLLIGHVDPADGVASVSYDDKGLLLVDTDAANASLTLARSGTDEDFTVTRTSAEGRVVSYRTQVAGEGALTLTNTGPDGSQAVEQRLKDEGRTYQSPDGTTTTTTTAADPRWGLNTPLVSTTVRFPSNLTSTQTHTRVVTLTDPLVPTSMTSQTDTVVVNGRTYRSVYTAGNRTTVTTSPANRIVRQVVDAQGRIARREVDGLTPVDFAYDSSGHLSRVTQGTRMTDFGYLSSGASKGMLQSVTNALGAHTVMTRDAAGLVQTVTQQSAVTGFAWDAVGNMTALTPPGKPAHVMGHTSVNLLSAYEPPAVGSAQSATSYEYNLDRQPVLTTRPGGEALQRTYDAAGRPDSLIVPDGGIQAGYIASGSGQGRLGELAGPYGVDLTFEYDGAIPKRTIWSGGVTGSVRQDVDADFMPKLEVTSTPAGTVQSAFGYDADLLLTCASAGTCTPVSVGSLILTRNAQHGLVTQLDQGSAREVRTYNALGEPATQVATYSGAARMSLTYHTQAKPRDALGRVVDKVEVLNGVTSNWHYTYDALQRLTDVTLNGSVAEHFDYDVNGNRTGYTSSAGTVTAEYDDQDRLLFYGDWEYAYGMNGDLRSKTNTQTGEETLYQYDVLGNLLRVTLADGRTIDYVVDALGRRVGKKVDGVLTQQWLYRNGLKPLVELDGEGNITKQFVYGSSPLVPEFMIAGGATYRIVSDQLGSPRMLLNVTTGVVAAQMLHSSFGELLQDTNPGFVPFGFAGGHYDADTGLVRFGGRDYDPQVGRWTTKDPSMWEGGQSNLYLYVHNDPVNLIDPLGTDAWSAAGAFATGVATAAIGGAVIAAGIASGTVIGGVIAVGVLSVGIAAGALTIAEMAAGRDLDGNALDVEGYADRLAGMAGGFVGGYGYARGPEFWMGKDVRVAPFGNRTGHPTGKYPHYHRRVWQNYKKGKVKMGQGLGRHRPWDCQPTDQGWKDRF